MLGSPPLEYANVRRARLAAALPASLSGYGQVNPAGSVKRVRFMLPMP
jgi:hypothetical protein